MHKIESGISTYRKLLQTIVLTQRGQYLRRPPKTNGEFRIDRLLKRKASEGVMIYIVVYKNNTVALPLESKHTKNWLQNVHRNIIGKVRVIYKLFAITNTIHSITAC